MRELDAVPRILHLARSSIDPSWWTYNLHDPFWRLYLNEQEGAEIVHPEGVYPLIPGRVHLVPAWSGGRARCRGAVDHRWMHIDPGPPWRDGGRCPGALGAALGRPWLLADPDLARRFRRLDDLPLSSPLGRLRALGVVAAALDALAYLLPLDARRPLGVETVHDGVTSAQRHAEAHLAEDLDLGDLAAVAGLSPSHLRAVFRERVGMPPMAWLRSRRVAVAAERLAATDLPIDEIAAATGFANRHHFTRVFTAGMGTSPAAYRRTGRTRRHP